MRPKKSISQALMLKPALYALVMPPAALGVREPVTAALTVGKRSAPRT
jgi:hypothetical protein